MTPTVTLKDMEIRCEGLRKSGAPDCSFDGCKNPVDHTHGMGWDTSCSYHRLLFDWWLYEIVQGDVFKDVTERRITFLKWTEKLGQDKCDGLVLEMANDSINWAT